MKDHKKKSLKERAEELIQDLVEAVESLFPVQPTLVPVASKPRTRRRR